MIVLKRIPFTRSVTPEMEGVLVVEEVKDSLPILESMADSLGSQSWLFPQDCLAPAHARERNLFRVRLDTYTSLLHKSRLAGLIMPFGLCSDPIVKMHRLSMTMVNLEQALREGFKPILIGVDGSNRGGSLQDLGRIRERVKDPRFGVAFVGSDVGKLQEMQERLGSLLQAVIVSGSEPAPFLAHLKESSFLAA